GADRGAHAHAPGRDLPRQLHGARAAGRTLGAVGGAQRGVRADPAAGVSGDRGLPPAAGSLLLPHRGGVDPQAVRRPRAPRDDGGLVIPAPVHLHQVRDRHRRGHRRARLGPGAVGAVHARGPGARHAAGREHADRLPRLRLARRRPGLQARARRDSQVAGRIGPRMGPADRAGSAGRAPRRRTVVAAARRAFDRAGHRAFPFQESVMQLVCPAGNLPALQAAIDAGADAVYAGFRDQTNARAFPGLNFDEQELRRGIAYAHARGRKVYLALNTYPDSVRLPYWQAAVDHAAELGVDAIIAAEMAVLDYAC